MFRVCFRGAPQVREVPFELSALGADAPSAADELWAEAQAKQPGTLSDGSIFNVTGLDGSTIQGHFISYKIFFAYRQQPQLFPNLEVRPLAVTGVCHCAGGILFGKRSRRVTQDPGLWEFAPSGGIDSSSGGHHGNVDYGLQFAQEFTEETGLSAELISEIRPICVVEDASSHVFDIVAHLILSESSKEFERALASVRNDEYQELRVVKNGDVEDFIEEHLDHVAPLTRYLMSELGAPNEMPS